MKYVIIVMKQLQIIINIHVITKFVPYVYIEEYFVII